MFHDLVAVNLTWTARAESAEVSGTNYGECAETAEWKEAKRTATPVKFAAVGLACRTKLYRQLTVRSGKACVQGFCVTHATLKRSTSTSTSSLHRMQGHQPTLTVSKRGQNVVVEGHQMSVVQTSTTWHWVSDAGAVKYLENWCQREHPNISYGEERPVCNESNENCWWRNRRAEQLEPRRIAQ